MTQKVHVMHGRDHCGPDADGNPAGADPAQLNVDATDNVGTTQGVRSRNATADEFAGLILTSTGDGGSVWQRLNSSGFAAYRDCVLAQPTLVELWPMDEPSGDLVGAKNGYVLTEQQHAYLGTTYPVHGVGGPFSDLPDDTAVLFFGQEGFSPGATDDLFYTNNATVTAVIQDAVSFTVEAWIYPTALPVSEARVVTASTAGANQFAITHTSAGQIAVIYAAGGISGSSATAVSLNAWAHIRVTYDTTTNTLKLYVDGVEAASTTITGTIGGTFTVGNSAQGGSAFRTFLGRIADVAIYSSVVTTFCPSVTTGTGSGNAAEDQVATADGAGGTSWTYPTIEVEF